jgi:hypothetical protein
LAGHPGDFRPSWNSHAGWLADANPGGVIHDGRPITSVHAFVNVDCRATRTQACTHANARADLYADADTNARTKPYIDADTPIPFWACSYQA